MIKRMRDVVIENINKVLGTDKNAYFLTADFGAPAFQDMQRSFKKRCINVGIAEQNMINIAAGLALEGSTVYAYAIAPFLSMRAYEQIRVNLSLHSQVKDINVNLVAVGAGLSYDVSGPTHHCLEDISIMNLLPNFVVFSPSDWVLADKFIEYSRKLMKPKYIRLDSKPLPSIYEGNKGLEIAKGFYELFSGGDVCIVSTGFMTHTAMAVRKQLLADNRIKIGVLDVFLLKPLNCDGMKNALKKYKHIITLEEGFIDNGGLGTLILNLLESTGINATIDKKGFKDKHVFTMGSRDHLHKLTKLDKDSLIETVKEYYKKPRSNSRRLER